MSSTQSGKQTLKAASTSVTENDNNDESLTPEALRMLERRLVRKIDLRLCTIAGILCSLNLLGEFE